MKRDSISVRVTRKMAKAVLEISHKSLGGKSKLLRRRLYRIAALYSHEFGYLWVQDHDEARDLLVWFQHAAFASNGIHQSTRAAFFSRNVQLQAFLGRSIVDAIALLDKAVK